MKLEVALLQSLEDCLKGNPCKVPLGADILWSAFANLSCSRSVGAHGPNPISFPEIESWARMMRVPLAPHHVKIIIKMDSVWMKHAYRDRSAPEGAKVLPLRSEHKLTPAMFDLAVG
ncbi:hypothetical protein [uncultured Roseovarius sp.]|uniref:phage tail assembly chaperone n=1 Tax=uncultured Roseovarius sp. TaxID=293344 RepID=UPI0026226315|nr:hypothetical protein [uncultured Roseovarius sp.]